MVKAEGGEVVLGGDESPFVESKYIHTKDSPAPYPHSLYTVISLQVYLYPWSRFIRCNGHGHFVFVPIVDSIDSFITGINYMFSTGISWLP